MYKHKGGGGGIKPIMTSKKRDHLYLFLFFGVILLTTSQLKLAAGSLENPQRPESNVQWPLHWSPAYEKRNWVFSPVLVPTLQMKGRWESNLNVWFRFTYSQKWNCATSLFPEQNYNVLSPNFHIDVSVSNLYIPTIGLPILLQPNR